MSNIITTVSSLQGGVTAVAGVSKRYRMEYTGTWAVGEELRLVLTDALTGVSIVVGYGTIAAIEPEFVFTYRNKENLLAGSAWYFSAISLPTIFNDTNGVGNGYVELSDAFSESADVQSLAPYQGKVAVLGTNYIQIWQIDADPNNYQLLQVLDNIGTIAKDSVKAFGELDVFFLHTTGIRSLRVRDSSSNAITVDVGSPIDGLVQSQIIAATEAEKAAACGVIEPSTSQYWLFLKDTIYVLSHFPSAKISAWSLWKPTYQSANLNEFRHSTGLGFSIKISMVNDVTKAFYSIAAPANTSIAIVPGKYIFLVDNDSGVTLDSEAIPNGLDFRGQIAWDNAPETFTFTDNQTAFVPEKFVAYNGQVFASSSDAFFVYGGADRNTYDNSICSFETSWLDFDAPAVDKNYHGIDVAQSGSWNHYASADYLSQTLQEIMRSEANPTFAGGKIGWANAGTHAKYRMQTDGTAAKAVVSNLLIHYKGNQNR